MKKRAKLLALMLALLMVMPLGLAACADKADEGQPSESAETTPEEETEIANPWSAAGDPEEAAKGAGLDGFTIPEGSSISLGEVKASECSYMADMAQVIVEFPAVQMTIRKANAVLAIDGDVSGDYNEYAYEWTQDIGGIEVRCFGNREGESTKTIWQSEDGCCYSISVLGLGGDTDYGLQADDLSTLVGGVH